MTVELSGFVGSRSLHVEVQERGDVAWVTAQGELHAATLGDLDDILVKLWTGPSRRVVLDVAELQVLDSSVLMVSVWKRDAHDHGIEFQLVDGQGTVQSLLQLLGPDPRP